MADAYPWIEWIDPLFSVDFECKLESQCHMNRRVLTKAKATLLHNIKMGIVN